MDYLTENERQEKLNKSITYSRTVWQHFVQNCHVDWAVVENRISEELSDSLKLKTTFHVEPIEDLEDNICYVDGNSTGETITIKFYCSPEIYSRVVTIPIQVLANLEHDFTKVVLHEYTSIISIGIRLYDDPVYNKVHPLTLESFASELAYDFVVTGNVAQSDVHDRFVQSRIPEVKSELYHRAILKAEAFSKIK